MGCLKLLAANIIDVMQHTIEITDNISPVFINEGKWELNFSTFSAWVLSSPETFIHTP